MTAGARPEDSWPVVPIEKIRRGAVVMLPTVVDGDHVERWIGPVRVASIRRAPVGEPPIAVVRWHGDGSIVLTGRLYRAGARQEPPKKAA